MSNKSNFTKDLNKCNGQTSKFIENFDIKIKKEDEINKNKNSNDDNLEIIERENTINETQIINKKINLTSDNCNDYYNYNNNDKDYDKYNDNYDNDKDKEKDKDKFNENYNDKNYSNNLNDYDENMNTKTIKEEKEEKEKEENEIEKFDNNFYKYDNFHISCDKEKDNNENINYNSLNGNKNDKNNSNSIHNSNCNFNFNSIDNDCENCNDNFEEDFSTKILNEDNLYLRLNEKDYIGFKDKEKDKDKDKENTDIPNSIRDNKSEKENKNFFMIPDEKNLSSNLKKRGRQRKNIFPKIDEKTKKEKNKGNQNAKNDNNTPNQKIYSINKKNFSENVWVHMSCALWIPEVHIEDFDKKENIKCIKK
jgi:hypothetical protein